MNAALIWPGVLVSRELGSIWRPAYCIEIVFQAGPRSIPARPVLCCWVANRPKRAASAA